MSGGFLLEPSAYFCGMCLWLVFSMGCAHSCIDPARPAPPLTAKQLAKKKKKEVKLIAAVEPYALLKWDDVQMLFLSGALRAAHTGGGLRKVDTLSLYDNKMGDRGIAALATLLEEGAVPKLERLYLHSNQISEAGVAALASALRGGAMPSCKELHLFNNQISDAGFGALATALRGGEMPSCTFVGLHGNPGSDAPVQEALASPERAAALRGRRDALVHTRRPSWQPGQRRSLAGGAGVARARASWNRVRDFTVKSG